MPRPKHKIKVRERIIEPQMQSPHWQPEPDPTIQDVDPEDQAIDHVFANLPQNENCIELYRTSSQGGRPKFLEQMMPSTFSMAYITDKYGGGMYRAKGRYKDGSDVKTEFEIEGDPFPVKRVFQNPSTSSGQTDPVTRIVRQIVDQEPDNGGDNTQSAMLALMRTMIQEMKGSEMAMLEKLQRYKELFTPQEKREAPMEQMLNMFTRGVEMAGLAGGEGGGMPWWMTVIRELKEPLTKIVDTVQYSIQQRPPVRPFDTAQGKPAPGTPAPGLVVAPPTSAPGVQAPPEPQSQSLHHPGFAMDTSNPAEQVFLLQFKAILPMLINGAAKNTDPDTYIDFVLDQLPVSGYDPLRTWLMKPDCLEALAQIEPGLRFQQEWWNSLRSGLLEALNEELGHAVRTLHADPPPQPPTEPPPDHDEAS